MQKANMYIDNDEVTESNKEERREVNVVKNTIKPNEVNNNPFTPAKTAHNPPKLIRFM